MPALLSAYKRLSDHSRTLLFSLMTLIMVGPLPTSGQSIGPAGVEYGVTAPLATDQVLPSLALGPNGGWVVWQDKQTDRLGIAAGLVNSSFGPVTDRTFVNTVPPGDQERPQAALLNNGNAIVVWQGGTPIKLNIYARILSPNGFVSGDVRLTANNVNVTNHTTTNVWALVNNVWTYKTMSVDRMVLCSRQESHDPAVAVLTNGNAVVIYSGTRNYSSNWTEIIYYNVTYPYGYAYPVTNSVRRWLTNSFDDMEEIFAVRLSPTGTKLCQEAVVNQFSAFNQRQPAVAGLANGNYVVVWVSEQRFDLTTNANNYVVISGRCFNPRGEPLSDEFRIDGTGPAVCERPAVCADAQGGFIVAWGQRDKQRINGWDVYGRVFGPDRNPTGPAFRINSCTLGYQYGPKLAESQGACLAVWTSLGQDGSMEGVYGRLIADGVLASEEFQVNTTTRNKQIQPVVAATGPNRFLVVWSQYARLASGFDLEGQKYGVLPGLAAPDAPSVAATGMDALQVSWPELGGQNLLNYSLYVDGAASPMTLANSSYAATGLQPGSTHSFRLAYTQTDGQRSKVSPSASGTTWITNSPPGGVNEAETGTGGTQTGTGTGVSGGTNVMRISLSLNGTKIGLQWNSEPGLQYQLQTSTNLTNWVNVGAVHTATESVTTQNCVRESEGAFFRVVCVQ